MPAAAVRAAHAVPEHYDHDDELLDIKAVCRLFGGTTRPLDPSTIYKGIKRGIFPKPVYPLPQTARWRRSECRAALDKLLAVPRRPPKEGSSPAAEG